MKKQDIGIDDIVFFKPYPDSEGCRGKVVRIGTKTELGMLFIIEDGVIFYELESVKVGGFNSVFTRTSKQWITKI